MSKLFTPFAAVVTAVIQKHFFHTGGDDDLAGVMLLCFVFFARMFLQNLPPPILVMPGQQWHVVSLGSSAPPDGLLNMRSDGNAAYPRACKAGRCRARWFELPFASTRPFPRRYVQSFSWFWETGVTNMLPLSISKCMCVCAWMSITIISLFEPLIHSLPNPLTHPNVLCVIGRVCESRHYKRHLELAIQPLYHGILCLHAVAESQAEPPQSCPGQPDP